MTKKQALDIISKCAKLYHKHLENKQIVFVYRNSENQSDYTEVQFHPYNYLHFTGVIPRKGLNAGNFYRYALNSRLSEKDFSFKDNHTTELKLQVLEIIMNIDKRARMIGNYEGTNLELYTEKVTGTITACLGLVQKNNIYFPNSVLKEDIRNIISKPPGKIYAILKKNIKSKKYTEFTYRNNNMDIILKCLPQELVDKIEDYVFEEES